MNRIATPTTTPSRPSLIRSRAIVAKLQLNNDGDRRLHELIRRFHTGRWPTFRALGMRQIDGAIVEAVQWYRMKEKIYSVVWWRMDGLGLSWQHQSSSQAALTCLRHL